MTGRKIKNTPEKMAGSAVPALAVLATPASEIRKNSGTIITSDMMA